MKKLLFIVPLCLTAVGAGAVAAHLSIKGRFSTSIAGSDNYFLRPNPSGTTFKSLNSLDLYFLARTPLTDYKLATNVRYFKYLGPGAQDTSLTYGTPFGATFSINHKQKLTTYQLSASFSREDLASTLFEQTGISTGRGFVDTYATQGTITHQITPLDSVSWTNKASRVTYTNGQTPYFDVTSSANWDHTLSRTITLTQAASFDWFSLDDQANTQRLFWTLTTGAKARLSHRLSLNGSFGIDFSNSYQTGTPQTSSTASQLVGGAGNGLLANIALTYQLLKETSLTLAAGQTTFPTILGNLQTSRSVSLAINRKINHLSSISASTQYSQNESTGTTYDLFSTSLRYTRRLARRTSATLSYTFQNRNDGFAGSAQANTVTLALTHDMTLLP